MMTLSSRHTGCTRYHLFFVLCLLVLSAIIYSLLPQIRWSRLYISMDKANTSTLISKLVTIASRNSAIEPATKPATKPTTKPTKLAEKTPFSKHTLDVASLPVVQAQLVKINQAVPRLSGTGFMYVHPFNDVVSNNIRSSGFFEATITGRFMGFLKQYPDAKFVDFGANIGYYSLIAAHMNRKVVAVEANPRNAAVFYKSILHNNFTKSINLLNMAVGTTSNEFVSLATEVNNMGNTIVQDNPNSSVVLDYNGKINPMIKKTEFKKIRTITINDLTDTDLASFSTAIVKMDIQGHELKALRSADKFFSKIKIPAFFIEWVNFEQPHLKNEAKELGEIFLKRGFLPYNPVNMAKLVPQSDVAGTWTYDVLFIKKI